MSQRLTPVELTGAITSAPGPGWVRFGWRAFAGFDYLAMRSAQGYERLIQSGIARRSIGGLFGQTNSVTLNVLGQMSIPTALATATGRVVSTASRATRNPRIGFVSAATAAATTGHYYNAAGALRLALGDGLGAGGFEYVCHFVPSDPAIVAGARMFAGVSSSVAVPTNVEPSALTNVIGVAQLSTSSNLQIVFGGSTPQPPFDLGANFPASGASTDLYRLSLTSDPNDNTKVGYRVDRIGTAFSAEGVLPNTTPGTTLPATTTLMHHRLWRTNNATALAVAIDLVQVVIEYDF